MPSHVALLRGINIGPHKRVAMPALRELVSSLGHEDVSTYIASGNVVFTSGEKSTAKLAGQLEKAVARELGVECKVIVLTSKELAQAVRDNPWPDEPNPKAVHATFLSEDPDDDLIERVAAAQEKSAGKGSRDEAKIVGRVLFLHTPDGFGRSELAAALVRDSGKNPDNSGTARNWATVTKLLELCSG